MHSLQGIGNENKLPSSRIINGTLTSKFIMNVISYFEIHNIKTLIMDRPHLQIVQSDLIVIVILW